MIPGCPLKILNKWCFLIAAVLTMASDQYRLKWNHHWTNIVGAFNTLLKTETFVDVTIVCDGQRLKAHRLVLSSCSPYFKQLLVDNPDKHPVVILKGVKYEHLKAIVYYIYNGKVKIDPEELPALISIANELKIRGLADRRLNESQIKVAAAKSLGLVEAEILKVNNIEDEESEKLDDSLPAVSIEASTSAEADLQSKCNADSEPLSLVTSSDQPTDLTSNSRSSKSPEVTSPSFKTNQNSSHTNGSDEHYLFSPHSKKRKFDHNGLSVVDQPENLSANEDRDFRMVNSSSLSNVYRREVSLHLKQLTIYKL